MSEDLFYERIENISGVPVIGSFEFTPTYGSAVAFQADNLRFDTDDGYFKVIPNGINSLKAKFSLKYQENEEGARKLTRYYENSKGVDPIIIRTDNSIYNDITGYCTEYSINHVNNQNYEFNAMLEVLESPGNLNWTGLNYLNYDFKKWTYNTEYKKHDVIYAEVNDIKTNNFFYCAEDHLSSVSNSPIEDGSPWSQEFYWNPDQGLTNSVKFENPKHGFGYSIYDKIKKNTAIVPLNYNFSNITTQQLKSMLHFLENKEGYRRFKHQIPSVYNRPKVYYCDSWNHTMVYDNTHNLQLSFTEDPMGVLPRKDTVDSDTVFTVTTNSYDSAGNILAIPGEDNPLTGDIPTNYCIDNKADIRKLEIGLSCTYINDFAFRNCENLSGKLNIPYSVTGIGRTAFGNSNFVTNVKLSGDLILPDSVKYVGVNAFLRAAEFDGIIKLSESLDYIEENSFRNLQKITGDLIVPNSITGIGEEGFYDMRSINSITIGSGIIDIQNSGFAMPFEDNILNYLRILAPTPPTVGNGVFSDLSVAGNILYVPSGASGAYNSAGAPWTDFVITEDE